AACRRGRERLAEVCARHGRQTVADGMETLLDRTAERVRAAFESWPARTVVAEGYMDDGGFEGTPPLRIRAAVTVRDGVLEVDLAGTSEQVASGVNVPIASTHAGVFFAVRCFVGREGVQQNDGLTRQI